MSNLYKYLETAINAGYGEDTGSVSNNKKERCCTILQNIIGVLSIKKLEDYWEKEIASHSQFVVPLKVLGSVEYIILGSLKNNKPEKTNDQVR